MPVPKHTANRNAPLDSIKRAPMRFSIEGILRVGLVDIGQRIRFDSLKKLMRHTAFKPRPKPSTGMAMVSASVTSNRFKLWSITFKSGSPCFKIYWSLQQRKPVVSLTKSGAPLPRKSQRNWFSIVSAKLPPKSGRTTWQSTSLAQVAHSAKLPDISKVFVGPVQFAFCPVAKTLALLVWQRLPR